MWRKVTRSVGLVLATLGIGASGAAAQDAGGAQLTEPPLAKTGRVVDAANVPTPQAEASMAQMLEQLERDLGVEFAVVSTADLEGADIAAYADALHAGWALGDPQRGDGMLLVVAPSARQARFEVGPGLKPLLADEFLARVTELMIPSFREGAFGDGMMIAVVTLDTRLRKIAADAAG